MVIHSPILFHEYFTHLLFSYIFSLLFDGLASILVRILNHSEENFHKLLMQPYHPTCNGSHMPAFPWRNRLGSQLRRTTCPCLVKAMGPAAVSSLHSITEQSRCTGPFPPANKHAAVSPRPQGFGSNATYQRSLPWPPHTKSCHSFHSASFSYQHTVSEFHLLLEQACSLSLQIHTDIDGYRYVFS